MASVLQNRHQISEFLPIFHPQRKQGMIPTHWAALGGLSQSRQGLPVPTELPAGQGTGQHLWLHTLAF